MDIKTLLKQDSESLDKLSQNELQEYFAPYLKFIVPVKDTEKKETRQRFDTGREAQRTLQMAAELMKKFNIPQK